ncbi:MAG TPA: hypothetical protein VFF67_04085 [Thermoplasmata archaeon]|nr:hypothetical protein [Thermoplasmata archaeon]
MLAGVLLVGVLLVGSIAPAPAAPALLTAPYAGVVVARNLTHTMGCGNATLPLAPSFSLATGIGTMDLRAVGRACTSATNAATVKVVIKAEIPFRIHASGSHRVQANVSGVVHFTENLLKGTCTLNSNKYSYCDIAANESLFAYAYVADRTNGTMFGATNDLGAYNSSLYYSYCYGGSCSSYSTSNGVNLLGKGSLNISGTWNQTHRYDLVLYVDATATAGVSTYQASLTGARAAAEIGVAGGRDRIQLASIAVY